MTKKTIGAAVQLSFIIDNVDLTKKQWYEMFLDIEKNLNKLPSQMLTKPFYTGPCGLRFHFKDVVEELPREDEDEKE